MPRLIVVNPQVPVRTTADTMPGYEAISFYGVGAPAGRPAEIADKLNREINLAMPDPEIDAFFNSLGTIVSTGPAADFGRLMDAEGAKWAAAVKASGASLE